MTSTAIYTCYRQLHPPTGVDHAVFGSVTGSGSRDLVVAKASILELYRVHREDPDGGASTAAGDGGGAAGTRPAGNEMANGGARSGSGGGGGGGKDDGDDDASTFYIELAGTFPLAGNITALAAIPVSATSTAQRQQQQNQQQQQQDILVVSFGAAKMALVAYDAVLGRLETLSIHNFDAGAIGPGAAGVEPGYGLASALKDRPKTISSSDPAGRCLSAVVAGCQLVVLPARRHVPRSVFASEEAARRRRILRIRRRAAAAARSRSGSPTEDGGSNGGAMAGDSASGEEEEDEEDSVGARESESDEDELGGEAVGAGGGDVGGDSSRGHAVVAKPFTIDLEEAGVTGFIKAAAFLEGFHEPALAILYEPIQTCAGRLATKRCTCRLVVLSINLTQGRGPVIWQVDSLPHDSWDLVAVPSPVGGVQVISTNAMIHVSQSEVLSILAVNGYARATVDPALLGCPLRGGDSDWGWASFRRSHAEREVVDLSSYDVCIELDVVRSAFLTPTSMLLSLRTGEVYALRLHLAVAAAAATGVFTGVATPNRVVGQSLRPVGRASPCSVLAVSASGEGRRGGGDGGEAAERASTGLVFMGSRVGDSLLVKYAVASAGAQPGRRGKDAAGALVAKKEPKTEVREEGSEGNEGGGTSKKEGGSPAGPSTNGSAGGQKGAGAVPGGEGDTAESGDVPAGAGGSGAAVKQEPQEMEEEDAARVAGMEVDSGAGDSSAMASGGGIGSEPESNLAGDDGEEAAGGGDAGDGVQPAKDEPSSEMREATGTEAVGSEETAAAGSGSPGADGDAPAITPTKQRRDAPASREPRDGSPAAAGGGSAKRGRAERSPSEDAQEDDGDVRADGDAHEDQPGRKRPRVSSSVLDEGSHDDAMPMPAEAAPASKADEAGESEVDPADRGAASPTAPSERATSSGKVDAMDTTPSSSSSSSPPPPLDSSPATGGGVEASAAGSFEHGAGAGAESAAPIGLPVAAGSNHGDGAAATAMPLLSREEQEAIQEEEQLYGARIGSSTSVGAVGAPGAALARLGAKGAERVIEAVGFRLRVVDSICTLGPIVDAALVPSAYHVPKTVALAAPGGPGGVRSKGSRGGQGAKGRAAAAAKAAAKAAVGGGGTSGGGIRTSLVCAAGYGQQGSLAVFSAGLRTEVVVELPVPGATGVYAAPEGRSGGSTSSSDNGVANLSRDRDTLVLVSCSSPTPLAALQTPGAAATRGGPGHTRVLAFEEDARVVELPEGGDGNPFVCDATTVDVCSMAEGTIVQAHAQGLRVTRNRDPVQDVLTSDPPEVGGLGAETGVAVIRAAAAGSHACCLLSDRRLHLMTLDDGDLMPAGYAEEDPGGGGGVGGVWEGVEAMCMFGIQEQAGGPGAPDNAAATPAAAGAADSSHANGDAGGGSSSSSDGGIGLFLKRSGNGESRSREEEDLAGGGGGGGVILDGDGDIDDDEDEEDDDDDEEEEEEEEEESEGGYVSEDEEWATLYGPDPGRGILNPCAEPRPGVGRAAADSVGERSLERSEEGDALTRKQQPEQQLGAGWWGGAAWGPSGSRTSSSPAAAAAAADADVEDEEDTEGEDTTSAYLVVCAAGGSVEVFSCEGKGAEETRVRPVFRASGAALAPSTLWNELLLAPPVDANAELAAAAAAGGMSEEDEEESSLANGGGSDGGDRSPMVEDLGRGAGLLAVATGVVVANGRRGQGAGEKVGEGLKANGSSAPGNAGASGVSGAEPLSSSDPMEVDGNAHYGNGASAAGGAAGEDNTSGGAKKGSGDAQGGAPAVAAAAVVAAAAGEQAAAKEEDEDGVVCPAVTDVIVHPVGAVDGPPELRRLVLAFHLDNGSLLVYEARMSAPRLSSSSSCDGREQVVCFSKLCHDLITRPVKGVPPEAAVSDPARGRALRSVRSAAGQEGVCFARPGCRSALILAERGAVCITAIAQDDLGDGSGNPPLPPGAPPSWAGIGLGSLAPVYNPDAFTGGGGGGFAGITAGGGRLRFISAAPATSQLVTPGASGGGGLGGGGQGHYVAEKVSLGATVHGLLHLPHQLAQPGKTGDILKQLLRGRGHYVALVSTMEDALAEQPKAGLQKGEEGQGGVDGDDDEEEEAAGLLDRHIVKHKNWTVADPSLGGAPALLVPKFELRVLALAPGAESSSSSSASATATATSSASSAQAGDGDANGGAAKGDEDGGQRGGGGAASGGQEYGASPSSQSPSPPSSSSLLSAAVVESHPMDSDENGICMALVRLEQGGSPRMYVAVGTGMNEPHGEDKAARGRLLLFEVDYAYLAREDGKHEHAVKLRQVFAKEQLGPVSGESGPVSAVAQLGRHLILSVGKKIIVNRWDPKSCTLELIGFHDPLAYVMSLSVIKQRFVLVGDAYGSVQLVVWREEDHSLTALSKDHEDCQVFSAEYLIDEPGMGIVVADGRRNIKVLQYAPNATNSRGGTKLLCQSDFYLGSRVAKLTRRRTRGNLRDGARYCLLAGTLDGGLGAILPVDERVFRRLYALQGIMSNALGHNGAANPRAYRLYDHGPTFRYETKQNMLDGTLLWRFVGLDAKTQHDLTRAIGTTVDRVMANLLDIDLASLF